MSIGLQVAGRTLGARSGHLKDDQDVDRDAHRRERAELGAAFAIDDHTRLAVKATVAALGATLAGRVLSAEHWYWAVIAAFIVFSRSETSGQVLARAWQRVLGTMSGVAAGLIVAEAAYGHREVELVLLFAFVALGFYLYKSAYAAYAFLLTLMLAMLYGLIGNDSGRLLVVRLEETLVGGVIAAVTAATVMPWPTETDAAKKSATVLRKGARLLAALGEGTAAREALREVDRAMRALRQALEPVTDAIFPAPKDARRQQLRDFFSFDFCLHQLYASSGEGKPGAYRAAIDRIERLADKMMAIDSGR